MLIEGGFALIGRAAFIDLNAQISAKNISIKKARAIFAFIEMQSIRKAAEASKPEFKKGKIVPLFSAIELSKISKLSVLESKRFLKEKLSLEQIIYSKGKLIPIPRRILRFLASCEKRSTFLTLLSYLERSMAFDRGLIKNAGTCKASLIAEKTGLTIRSVRAARKDLLTLGIITPDTTRYQKKLNRDGAYFTINLSWFETKPEVINRKGSEGIIKNPVAEKPVLSACSVKPTQAVDNLRTVSRVIAPLLVKNSPKISPPYRNKITSKELRNQKTQDRSSNLSGVYTTNFGKEKIQAPKIYDVKKEDLESFGRTETLYFQAIKRGLIENSEASAINFLAAAVRARSVEAGDSVKVFMGIIRKKLWKNIRMADEDRALLALRKYRADNSERFRFMSR